jgi:hypothetical protein
MGPHVPEGCVMGYWMHVYSRSEEVIKAETVRAFFKGDEVNVEVGEENGSATEIFLSHPGDDQWPITLVRVHTGDVSVYVEEATERALHREPACNAEWVVEFLRGVKVIYSFQILSGTDVKDGWDYVHALQEELCDGFDGILYAEAEGFSNLEGDHITWEFSDRVHGEWSMALYDARTDSWRRFRMELGDAQHRAAFRAGRVPDGVKAR